MHTGTPGSHFFRHTWDTSGVAVALAGGGTLLADTHLALMQLELLTFNTDLVTWDKAEHLPAFQQSRKDCTPHV